MSSRVLIVGGGVAGLEAAIALRELARDRVEAEMCSPRKDFVYRPFAVAEPYGSRMLTYDLRQLTARCEASFRLGTVGSIDSEKQRARMHDGEELSYDHVIVGCGTRLLAGVAGAVTFWGAADDSRVQGVVRGLRERGLRSEAFTMPAGCNWALPLCELALLASSELSRAGVDGASLVVVTPEETPLQLALEPDPSDGRARIIRLTDRGKHLHRVAVEEHAAVEEEWGRAIGSRRYRQVRSGLGELVGRTP